jgi:hypothetical protein
MNNSNNNNREQMLRFLVDKYKLRLTSVKVPLRPLTPSQLKKALTHWRLNACTVSTYENFFFKILTHMYNSNTQTVLSSVV